MKLIKCPDVLLDKERGYTPVLFLAGGISYCPDWQSQAIEHLKDMSVILLNPRRKSFDIHDAEATEVQIRWEYHHIHQATEVLFWFPKESICPITLFELGRALQRDKYNIYIGTHPEYCRKNDIQIQSGLMGYNKEIFHTLSGLCDAIKIKHGRHDLVKGDYA